MCLCHVRCSESRAQETDGPPAGALGLNEASVSCAGRPGALCRPPLAAGRWWPLVLSFRHGARGARGASQATPWEQRRVGRWFTRPAAADRSRRRHQRPTATDNRWLVIGNHRLLATDMAIGHRPPSCCRPTPTAAVVIGHRLPPTTGYPPVASSANVGDRSLINGYPHKAPNGYREPPFTTIHRSPPGANQQPQATTTDGRLLRRRLLQSIVRLRLTALSFSSSNFWTTLRHATAKL